MVKVRMDKDYEAYEVLNIFQNYGISGDSFNEAYNDQVEVISDSHLDAVSGLTRRKILQKGEEKNTEYEGMEEKWFFYLEDEFEGEFSFGGYVTFYEDEEVIGEFDYEEDDNVYQNWLKDIQEFCKDVGWEILK